MDTIATSATITITIRGGAASVVHIELEPHEAAALARLCQKLTYSDCGQYLYGHVAAAIRDDQAYHMIRATSRVADALAEAGVSGWPWIEIGAGEVG